MQTASHSRRRSQTVLTAAALAGLGLLPSLARAADIHWNVADGDWNTNTNWNPNTVPTNPDRAVLDAAVGSIANVTNTVPQPAGVSVTNGNVLNVQATGVLNNADTDGDANGVRIGDAGAGSANVTGGGQLLTTGGGGDANVWVGIAGGTGTLTQSGATSKTEGNDIKIGEQLNSVGVVNFNDGIMNSRAWTLIGNDAGDGTLNVGTVGGGNPVYTAVGSDFLVGNGTGSKGTVNQVGGTVTGGWTQIGKSGGTGTYNLSGGTFNTRNDNLIGNETGSTGRVHQTGGTYAVSGVMFLGNTGTGTFTLDGGLVTTGSDIMVGNNGGASGTFLQNGGTVHMQNGWAFVGRDGASGLYRMTAGEAKFGGNLNVGFNPGGVGTFNQEGGIVRAGMKVHVNESHAMHIGRGGGNGTYNLSGGELIVGLNDGIVIPPDTSTTPPTNLDPDGVDNDLVVGADGGTTGVLNQTGGSITVNRWGFVGRNNGSGTFNQSAGTYASKGWMRVADGVGAQGQYNLSGNAIANIGGGDDDNGDNDVLAGIAPLTSGTITVADNAVLNAARDVRLGHDGGNGTLTQTGGTINVAGVVDVGNTPSPADVTGTGTMTLTGGTMNVAIDLNIAQDDVNGVGETPSSNVEGTVAIGGTAAVTANGGVYVGRTGTGVLNQTGGSLTTGSLVIRDVATASGDYNLSGGTVTALSTTNNGTLDASGTGVANLGPVGGSGVLSVANTAVVNADHVRLPSISMTGGTVRITPTTVGSAEGVSIIPTYSLSGNARFNLTDNKLLTSQSAGTATEGTYNGVQGQVQSAYNFGAWNGPGLTTDQQGALDGITTIGVATGEQIRGLGPTDTDVWAGQTINGATTIAMYTYAGDANLDGQVDAGDYGILDAFIQIAGADGYGNGDFNYDGFIDAADYGTIDNSIQFQGAPFFTSGSAGDALAGVTAVPEPATLSVLGVAAMGLLNRRRRTK